jgi:hypothetical protein
MKIHGVFAGLALLAAVAGTSLLGSVAAHSAYAAGSGASTINEPIPTYVLPWENPLVFSGQLPTPVGR